MSTFLTVPYSHLSLDPLPVALCDGLVNATIRLASPGSTHCLLSLPQCLFFDGGGRDTEVSLGVGQSFQVEYRDRTTELRIGRPFSIRDD